MLNKEIINTILNKLWSYFDLGFASHLVSGQYILKDTSILFKIYRKVKHY